MTSSLTTQTYLHWQAEAGALENVFFSPLGLEMVLSMLLPGLRGERLREVCGFLGISEAEITEFLTSQTRSLQKWAEILAALPEPEKMSAGIDENAEGMPASSIFHALNRGWAAATFPLREDFQEALRTYFCMTWGEIPADPADIPVLQNEIDTLVNRETRGLIPDLKLPIKPLTSLILINILYAQGAWMSEFREYPEGVERFRCQDGRTVLTPFLEGEFLDGADGFRYFKGEDFAALRILCLDERFAVELWLPDDVDGLPDLLRKFSPAWDRQQRERFRRIPALQALIPKFEIAGSLNVSDSPYQAQLAKLFEMDTEEWEGIFVDSSMGMKVDLILQKAKFRFEKDGFEAAAVTVMIMCAMIGMPCLSEPEAPVLFLAQHPFMFHVRDLTDERILFTGTLSAPEGEEVEEASGSSYQDRALQRQQALKKRQQPTEIESMLRELRLSENQRIAFALKYVQMNLNNEDLEYPLIKKWLEGGYACLQPNAMGILRARFKRLHNELVQPDQVPAKALVSDADRKRLVRGIEAENGFGALWIANRLICFEASGPMRWFFGLFEYNREVGSMEEELNRFAAEPRNWEAMLGKIRELGENLNWEDFERLG